MNAGHKEIDRFYELVAALRTGLRGGKSLKNVQRSDLPNRGVYFFFEQGEFRNPSGEMRVIRVGTHGLHEGSQSTLYGRLRQHRGGKSGHGNHRGSIFRGHVGRAIINRDKRDFPSWLSKTYTREIRESEAELERAVSDYLGSLTVLWLSIDDEPSAKSDRGFIERNAISLLSGRDSSSEVWLGRHSKNESIIKSHLWNVNHVDYNLESAFLLRLEKYVKQTIDR